MPSVAEMLGFSLGIVEKMRGGTDDYSTLGPRPCGKWGGLDGLLRDRNCSLTRLAYSRPHPVSHLKTIPCAVAS